MTNGTKSPYISLLEELTKTKRIELYAVSPSTLLDSSIFTVYYNDSTSLGVTE